MTTVLVLSLVFILLNGRARVLTSDSRGREVILAVLESGDYVGEMSLIDNEPHSATVRAEVQTDMLALGRALMLANGYTVYASDADTTNKSNCNDKCAQQFIPVLAPEIGASLKPLGDAFIRVIRMIIAPVVFCTVAIGIACVLTCGVAHLLMVVTPLVQAAVDVVLVRVNR